MRVNSQLVCLRPVGMLACHVYLKYLFLSLFAVVGHNENYWVTSNCVTPIKSIYLFILLERQMRQTLAHLRYLLPVNTVPLIIDKRSQKLLKPVLDLQSWSLHGNPLTYRMPFHILKVLYAFNKLGKEDFD